MILDVNDKKENFKNPYNNCIFLSYSSFEGHISKKHPKK